MKNYTIEDIQKLQRMGAGFFGYKINQCKKIQRYGVGEKYGGWDIYQEVCQFGGEFSYGSVTRKVNGEQKNGVYLKMEKTRPKHRLAIFLKDERGMFVKAEDWNYKYKKERKNEGTFEEFKKWITIAFGVENEDYKQYNEGMELAKKIFNEKEVEKVNNTTTKRSGFHVRLRVLRKGRGVKQQEVAEFVGVTQETISSYERGKTIPSSSNKIKLAKFYNVSYECLYGDLPEEEAIKYTKLKKEDIAVCVNEYGMNVKLYTRKEYVEWDEIPMKLVNDAMSKYKNKEIHKIKCEMDKLKTKLSELEGQW